MEELSKKEIGLIETFQKDFFELTGKKVQVSILTKMESLFSLSKPMILRMDVAFSCLCEGMQWDNLKVISSTRKEDAVMKRSIMYGIFYYNGFNLKSIGEFFSNRDHSTILHSLREVKERIFEKNDSFFMTYVSECKNYLEENYQTHLKRISDSEVYTLLENTRTKSQREALVKKLGLAPEKVEYAFKKAELLSGGSPNFTTKKILKSHLISAGIV